MRSTTLIRVAIFTVMVGVLLLQSAATAQAPAARNSSCPDGYLYGETIEGNLTVKNKACYVFDTVIEGTVTVTNSPYFALIDSTARGKLQIKGGCGGAIDCHALVRGTQIVRADLNVQGYEGRAVLSGNHVRLEGDIQFKNVDGFILLAENRVDNGNIVCTKIDGEVLSNDNDLRDGTDGCQGIN